jgi:integrase
MITEGHIKAAITSVARGTRRGVTLRDPGVRGGGRLSVSVRPAKARPSAEFYVNWQRDGVRRSTKIGAYPAMPLAEARRVFREDHQPLILDGRDPLGPLVGRRKGAAPTVEQFFEAYCSDLEDKGKPGASRFHYILLAEGGAADAIGRDRAVHTVRAEHITPHLKSIYDRGRQPLARYARDTLRSCFQWGLRSPHDVTSSHFGTDWGLRMNPVDFIKTIPRAAPRHRALTPTEFRDLWDWLEAKGRQKRYPLARAIQLLMATGQRPSEILKLTAEQFDAAEEKLSWVKTKNGRPHSIPLPRQALEILQRIEPNAHGLLFPRQRLQHEPAIPDYASAVLERYFKETGAMHFQLRDLRRTWKTLAGDASIPKEACDRLQNHAFRDVGHINYDRSDHWQLKAQAMDYWSRVLDHILYSATPLKQADLYKLPAVLTLEAHVDTSGGSNQ